MHHSMLTSLTTDLSIHVQAYTFGHLSQLWLWSCWLDFSFSLEQKKKGAIEKKKGIGSQSFPLLPPFSQIGKRKSRLRLFLSVLVHKVFTSTVKKSDRYKQVNQFLCSCSNATS